MVLLFVNWLVGLFLEVLKLILLGGEFVLDRVDK